MRLHVYVQIVGMLDDLKKYKPHISGEIPTVSADTVSAIARGAVCENLVLVSRIMKSCFIYSFSFDGMGKKKTPVVSIRCRVPGEDSNSIVLFACTLEEGTGEAHHKLIVDTLDTLDDAWPIKTYGLTADGCPANFGKDKGCVRRLRQQCHGPIIEVWCAVHRADHIFKEVAAACGLVPAEANATPSPVMPAGHPRDTGGARRSKKPFAAYPGDRLQDWVSRVRDMQQYTSLNMPACPLLHTVRWTGIHRCAKYFVTHREKVLRLCSGADVATPSAIFWCRVLLLGAIAELFKELTDNLQRHDLVLVEQAQYICTCKQHLLELFEGKETSSLAPYYGQGNNSSSENHSSDSGSNCSSSSSPGVPAAPTAMPPTINSPHNAASARNTAMPPRTHNQLRTASGAATTGPHPTHNRNSAASGAGSTGPPATYSRQRATSAAAPVAVGRPADVGNRRKRKEVYNTTVQIVTKRPPGADGGPAHTQSTLGRVTAGGFQHLWVQPPRAIPIHNGVVKVRLEGALEGEYTLNGAALLERWNLVLGSGFKCAFECLSVDGKEGFLTEFIGGVCKAVARQSALMQHFYLPAPPVLPYQYAGMETMELLQLLNAHEGKLRLCLAEKYDFFMKQIQIEHRQLRLIASTIPRESINTQPTSFKSHWEKYKATYPLIYGFAAGMATVYPGNSDVERDFAVLKWLFSPQRESIGISGLVGILICKQLDRVRTLAARATDPNSEGLLHAVNRAYERHLRDMEAEDADEE
eukprot:GHVU01119872.1.p1 GENE.GHVU01119872.1~~GHVU01119872.1.p1  ORF type:complete len:754 (+),score=93.95 GHVU01119872.1:386-2647(+)